MNIFALDDHPILAASAHADRHLHKMIVESTQMLSTVAQGKGVFIECMYKPTHSKHPCTLWVAESPHNRAWLFELIMSLHKQRLSILHKSVPVAIEIFNALAEDGDASKHTPFAQAMPDHLRGPDAIEAYRRYYKWKREQGMQLDYKSPSIITRAPPSWL